MPEQATLTTDLPARHPPRVPPPSLASLDGAAMTARRSPATHLMPLARWDRLLFDAGQSVPLVAPCLLVLLASLLFRWTNADLLVSELFYDRASEGRFSLAEHPVLLVIYYWGLVPAWLLGVGSLMVLAAATFRNVSPAKKRAAVFLLALLVLGPVLLVNVAYKGYWGRPRPDQTTHFGGSRSFLRVLDKGPMGTYHSFPSGHAAAGFCMLAPAFLVYRRRPRLAGACLALGLMGGLLVGFGRVIQGRHFASDVLWAVAVVYFTGCALDYLILAKTIPPAKKTSRPPAAGRQPAIGTAGRKPRVPAALPAKPRREAA